MAKCQIQSREETEGASHLPNGNALCLLFGSRFWERYRQDTILDLGFHVLSLGPEGELQRSGEFAIATFTDDVLSLLVMGFPRLTSNCETVLVDIDGDIVGCHAGQLKRGCHGVSILGLVNVHSWTK